MKFNSFNIKNYIVIFSILFCKIFAFKSPEPFEDQKMGKEHHIVFASESPVIDGNLNDHCWKEVIPITDFLQESPDNKAIPTERMEVYMTYDYQSLYVAARLYDSEPLDIVQQLAPHDDWYGAFDEMADWFSIDLDSRHDHQTGYAFAVNASGVRCDEMIYHDENYDNDWNAIWQAEVKIDDMGWIVEIEIPFSNLSFYESENMNWGMNLTRFIQRKHERIHWVSFPLDVEGIVSKYGHLNGLQGIYPPAKFEIKPFFTSGSTNYSDIRLANYERPDSHFNNYNNIITSNLGLDFFYRLSPNSRLVFTINPDYGQIESDPSNINLTAFETYFHEKREFFLKDIDIFNTPIEIFYSRRIGEKSWGAGKSIIPDTLRYNGTFEACNNQGGTIVNSECIGFDTLYTDIPILIKGAAKFTGRTESGFSYGLLGAMTALNDSSNWLELIHEGNNRNYFISRFKQELFSGNSFIGFMSTSSFADSSHIASFDYMGNLFDNQISLDVQFMTDVEKNKNGIYAGISYIPEGNFSGWIDHYQFDEGLNINALGYLWRDDYMQTKIGIKFESFEPWKIINNSHTVLELEMEENLEGLSLGNVIELKTELELENYWILGGGLYKIFQYYNDRKIIYDYERNEFGPPIFIPEIIGYNINISSDKYKKLWTSFSLTWAENERSDMERGQYVEINYKPNSYLTFTTSYDSYHLLKKYHWVESLYEFDGYHHIFSDLKKKMNVITFRSMLNVNKKLSLQGYLEIFSNDDVFTSYSEYSPDEFESENEGYFIGSDYISGENLWSEGNGYGEVYTSDATGLDNSYLDPNYYLGLYPKFTSFVFNGILKWNYMKGSNIYIIFSHNKSVNGKSFKHMSDFMDFMSFNEKEAWVDIYRDQTFMIKIDYWFEK